MPVTPYSSDNMIVFLTLSVYGQTFSLSIGVGTACTVFAPEIILEALIITAGIVLALTAYAFHASRKGKDFTFLGPILLTSTHPVLVPLSGFGFYAYIDAGSSSLNEIDI